MILIVFVPLFALAQKPDLNRGSVELGYQHLRGFQDKALNMNFVGMKVGRAVSRNGILYLGVYFGSQKLAFQSEGYFSTATGENERLNSTLMNRMNVLEINLALPLFPVPIGSYEHFVNFGVGVQGMRAFNVVNFASSEITEYPDENTSWDIHQRYKMGKNFSVGMSASIDACISLLRITKNEKGILPYLAIGYKLGAGGLTHQANYSFTNNEQLAVAQVKEEKSEKTFYFRDGAWSNSMYGALNIGLLWRYAPRFKE